MTHFRGEPELSGFRIPRDIWIRAVAKLSEFMWGKRIIRASRLMAIYLFAWGTAGGY